MRYRIVHSTEYFYGEPVPLGHNIVHLKPRETHRQTLLTHSLAVTPNPVARSERVDFFGNNATWFSLQEPHERLSILTRSGVEVEPFEIDAGTPSQPWDQVASMLINRRERQLLEARQFLYDSPQVQTSADLCDYARPGFTTGRPLLECVTELTNRINKEFTFDSRVTTVGTPIAEVLEHRHGVCQDFAHLQIGCLRSLGLAARYVSGYLVTRPPPGKPRLVGVDASHAWVSVFFPDLGWIDFDPTNGLIPSAGHITLGWARDYGDVSPVRGVVVGGRRHSLKVSVDVEPVAGDGD